MDPAQNPNMHLLIPSSITFLIYWAVVIGVYVLFILTIQNTLKLVRPWNQKMLPAWAWLIAIPIIGAIYIPMMPKDLSVSIENELKECGAKVPAKPTYHLGMAWALMNICTYLPVIKRYAFLPWLIFFILYWIQIGKYKGILIRTPPSDGLTPGIFGDEAQ